MTKQERMDILERLSLKLDRIIELLEVKNKSCEPITTFTPASNKANDKFIMDRQKEIFSSLDSKK